MGVFKNWGTPKSSILVGFSIINHPFWGFFPYFWKHPYIYIYTYPKQPGERRKNPFTFHYTGWLIGIFIMVYYNPQKIWIV